MTITSTFSWTPDLNQVPNISIEDWALTLTPEEQAAFSIAQNNVNALRNSYISSGKLTVIENNTEVWDSQESIDSFLYERDTADKTWFNFFRRWAAENNLNCQVIEQQS